MTTALFLFIAITTYLVMLVTYLPQSAYKDGMMFAVTLPKEAAQHDEIQRIRSRFKKDIRNLSMLFLVLLIPMFFISIAFQVVYFLIWLCVTIVMLVIPFRRAHRDTLALKRENNWFVGAKRVITTDLRAIMLKNETAAPYWLFAIPLSLSILLAIWLARSELFVLGIAAILITSLFLFLNMLVRNAKTKVYSLNSELNIRLNQSSRRIWSYTMLAIAFIEIVHFLLIGLSVRNDIAEWGSFWLVSSTVFTLVPLALILYANYKSKRIVNEAVETDGKTIYSDDDEYWGNGFTYHNPQDRKVFVEKRVGVGMTVNTGTTAGKWFIGTILGITAAVIIGVSFLIIRSELTSPLLFVTEDQHIKIQYPMYSFDFAAEDMREVALVKEVLPGRKINGEATDTYARGYFNLNEIGRTRLFVFKNNPPYIRIQLTDGYIYYNEKDPQQTERVYQQLLHLLKP